METIPEISVEELAARLEAPEADRPVLLDVRTLEEHVLVALPDSVLIPLHELEERTKELEPLRKRELVVYCHHGIRSLHGAALLRSLGYHATSLAGGIDRFARSIDQSLPRY